MGIFTGTPWFNYIQPPVGLGDPPALPSVIELNSSGLSQTWPTTTPLGINDAQGGTGGLYVGNGQGTTNGGPLMAGSLLLAVIEKSTAYNIATTDWLIEVTGTTTVTLPDATKCEGRQYFVINADSSNPTVTVNTSMSQSIMTSGSSLTLTAQGKAVMLVSDGTQWLITSRI